MALKRVDAQEAKKLHDDEDYVLLDVRSMPEYDAEHPAGAYNIPFLHKAPQGMVPNAEFAKVVQDTFPDKATKIVTSCQMGGRSVRAAQQLVGMGYENVVDLRGGFGGEKDDTGKVSFKGWVGHELPTEKGPTDGRAYKALYSDLADAEGDKPKSENKPATEGGTPQLEPLSTDGWERFAHKSRKVNCIRLKEELPALKRRPLAGELGDKIRSQISAQAWTMWVEHSKMIINEYKINPSDPKAQNLLLDQMNQFFFGEGAKLPDEYVPSSAKKAD